LWVNSHGLFILGLVAWGCFLADAIVRRLRSDRRRAPQAPRDDFRLWVGVTLGMAVAALANPYGYRGALFPLTLLQRIQGPDRGFYRQFAGEFDGLGEFIGVHGLLASLTNVTICMTLVLFALGVASFVRLGRQGKFEVYRVLLFT